MNPFPNPLLDWDDLPDFKAISAEHVLPAMTHVLERSTAELLHLETTRPDSWHALLVPLERLTDRVFRTWGLVSHLQNVHNSPELRAAHAQAQPLVVEFSSRLGQSEPVFQALTRLRDDPAFSRHSHALQRTISLLLRDARLHGVGLEPEQREHFNRNVRELAELSTRFTNNVLDSTRQYALIAHHLEDVAGLPEESLRLAARMAVDRGFPEATAEHGPWAITLDLPSFLSFMQHATRRDLRETVYKAYITRASAGEHDNLPILRRILVLRREQAALLGFAHFADMSLARKMAPSVDAIQSLLGTLQGAATDPALNDLIEITELARAHGRQEDLQPWDVPYWSERLKETRFGLNEEELRPYFPLPAILDGLFSLARDLFDITIVPREVSVWHPDVRFFHVTNAAGEPVAGFYLDLYARPELKRGGAWMDELTGRSTVCAPAGSSTRLPIAYINANQRPPLGESPSLMSFQEVTTLFHEFGHALQHMLTTARHGFVAGISNVEWDAVELPSQFMENWCFHAPTLSELARHFQTGAPLAEKKREALLRTRTFRAGSNTLRQVTFALTDLALHTAPDPQTMDPIALAQSIARDILPLPPLPEDRFLCAFSHVFAGGYAAGYYSYKWAEVLSADAFGAFANIDDPEERARLGRRFRDTVLSLGGGRPPMDIFRLFRGREPDPTALLRQEGLLPETPREHA